MCQYIKLKSGFHNWWASVMSAVTTHQKKGVLHEMKKKHFVLGITHGPPPPTCKGRAIVACFRVSHGSVSGWLDIGGRARSGCVQVFFQIAVSPCLPGYSLCSWRSWEIVDEPQCSPCGLNRILGSPSSSQIRWWNQTHLAYVSSSVMSWVSLGKSLSHYYYYLNLRRS